VLGVWPSLAPPAPGPVVLWKRNSLAIPTPGSGRNTPKPVPVSTLATAPRLVATQTLPEVGAGGVVWSLFRPGESGPHRKMARKMMLKHALEAARAAWESAEKSLKAKKTRAYLELGALEAQAHMSQVVAGELEDERKYPEGGEDEDVIDLSSSSPYIWRKLRADSKDENECGNGGLVCMWLGSTRWYRWGRAIWAAAPAASWAIWGWMYFR
jgi:hypothetical protein